MLYGGIYMKEYLKKYVEENYKILKILCICFFIGLVVGVIIFLFIDNGIKNELIGTMKNTLDLSKNDNFDNINIIKNGMMSNAILIAIIYFCAITLFAPMLICLTDVFKGFSIGLYIPVIFSIFGISKGLLVTLLIVIIPNLLYVPTFIFLSSNAIKFHYFLFENRESSAMIGVIRELVYILISFSIIILSVVLEQLLTLNVINIYITL